MATKQIEEPTSGSVLTSIDPVAMEDDLAVELAPAATPVVGEGANHHLQARRLQAPSGVRWNIAWRYAGPMAVMHLLALLVFVPWLFSWTGVVVFLLGVYTLGGIGINIGYHRLLSHRSF
ncbi:MAG: hypothetical protein ACR2NU_10410, partial [Aeoliella sp.]